MTLWTPANLTVAPALWFDGGDAATITASAGAVSQWNDKSGNARNATQSTFAQKPGNGSTLNSMTILSFGFGGAEKCLVHASTLATDYTAIYLCNPNDVTSLSVNCIHGGDVTNGALELASAAKFSPGGMAAFTNANSRIESGTAPTGWQILGFTPAHLYRNGTEVSYRSGASTVAGGSITTIGSRSDVHTLYFMGDIAEIVVCPSTISTGLRQLIEGYLAWKWGQSALLPVGHPYASAAPTISVGALASTSDSDSLSAAGIAPARGTLSATSDDDTEAATGVTPVHGALAVTEASDTATAAGVSPVHGSLASASDSDTGAATGIAPARGALAATEANDTATGAGLAPARGAGAIIEANDTATGTGGVPLHGALSGVESDDAISASGIVPARGALGVIEDSDTIVAFSREGGKMLLGVAEDGYSVAFPADARADKVDGGLSRTRAQVVGSNPIATVQWFAGAAEFDYFRAFYRQATEYGGVGFSIDLIVDNSELTEYIAKFVPGSLQIAQINGDAYIIGAQLEVVSMASNPSDDAAIAAFYAIYGDGGLSLLAGLAELVNTTCPTALG